MMVPEYVSTVPHGVEYLSENLACICDLVRFRFAVVVTDVSAMEPISIVSG